MWSGLKPGLLLHGKVVAWQAGCGDIIEWDGWPELGTGMPNPNVHRDHSFRGELLDTARCAWCGRDESAREQLCVHF
jgi:hypothetical protein